MCWGFSLTGAEMETLKPEVKWRIISDFYQKKIAQGEPYTVMHFFENGILWGSYILIDAEHWCWKLNQTQKRSGTVSGTDKSVGKWHKKMKESKNGSSANLHILVIFINFFEISAFSDIVFYIYNTLWSFIFRNSFCILSFFSL